VRLGVSPWSKEWNKIMPFAAATKNNSDNDSTLLKALKDHHVTAKVVDCDQYVQ
jgi:hypothetical protein